MITPSNDKIAQVCELLNIEYKKEAIQSMVITMEMNGPIIVDKTFYATDKDD